METKLCDSCKACLLDYWDYCPMCGKEIKREVPKYATITTGGSGWTIIGNGKFVNIGETI